MDPQTSMESITTDGELGMTNKSDSDGGPSSDVPIKQLRMARTVSLSIDSTGGETDDEVLFEPAETFGKDNEGRKPSKRECIPSLPSWFFFYFRRTLFALAILTCVVMLVFFIGAEIQYAAAVRAGGTTHLYQTPNICGIEGVSLQGEGDGGAALANSAARPTTFISDPITIRTFDSLEALQATPNTTVAHCGDCGQCSNPQDVKIYDDTRSTLFESSYKCARKSILGGAGATRDCLRENVGFTEGCNDCWVENIMCTLEKCVFACLWHTMWNDMDTAGSDDTKHELNRCTQCDEQMCGPRFVQCAGANRRQTGILSEFDRDNENEVCKKVEYEWWKDVAIQDQWKSQQPQDSDRRLITEPRANLRH